MSNPQINNNRIVSPTHRTLSSNKPKILVRHAANKVIYYHPSLHADNPFNIVKYIAGKKPVDAQQGQ